MTPQGHVALISSKDLTWQINSLQQLSGDDQFLLQTLSLTFEACGRVHCVGVKPLASSDAALLYLVFSRDFSIQ